MITIDEFKKGEIMIGEIKNVELIEGSDKLLKLTVDFAEEKPRTVVSGIKKYLEPRPLMGIPSEAMILAVSTDTTFSLLKVTEETPSGTKVR
jgi:methionyl-tRNA synthetase